MPTPQNGQTQSNNSSATAEKKRRVKKNGDKLFKSKYPNLHFLIRSIGKREGGEVSTL